MSSTAPVNNSELRPQQCQCCRWQFVPESEVKLNFPVLCWTCSHQVIADLAMFLRRSSKYMPPTLQESMNEYMKRKGIEGSILR